MLIMRAFRGSTAAILGAGGVVVYGVNSRLQVLPSIENSLSKLLLEERYLLKSVIPVGVDPM
jgi:hypothetical protein